MMTIDEYLDIALSDFRQEILKNNSLKECYKALPNDYSPKSNLVKVLHEILLKEADTERWKSLGETAPSIEVVKNILNDRTKLKPLYKEAWAKGLNVPLERLT